MRPKKRLPRRYWGGGQASKARSGNDPRRGREAGWPERPHHHGIEERLKTEPRWQTLRGLARGLGVEIPDLIRLGIEMASGEGGDVLRRREREALDAEKGRAG